MNIKELPKKFLKYENISKNWEKLCTKYKMSKYEISLKYALSNKYIDRVIIGVDNSNHFKKLINSAGFLNIPIKSVDASNHIDLINPAKW